MVLVPCLVLVDSFEACRKMANEQSGVKFFVIFTVILVVVVPGSVRAEEEGENPWLEVAQTLVQESTRNQKGASGLHLLGGIVQGLMQTEGGKQIGAMLAGNQKGNGDVAELLAGLGTLWQAAKTANSGHQQQNGKEESSFDPSVMGTMIDLFSTLSKAAASDDNQGAESERGSVAKEKQPKDDGSVNWDAVLQFAGNVMSSMSGNQGKSPVSGSSSGFESFISFLPVLLSSLSGQHNIHASAAIPHHSHEQFLPPFLENLHEYWDHFVNSKFGKSLWENSGLADLAKVFANEKGEFEAEKVFASLENHSFRRLWVRSISAFIAQGVKHFTDPKIQGKYMDTAQLVCNSFLKTQGYPKETLIDFNRPAESLSALTNHVFKKQFDLRVDSAVYLRPVVSYVQEIFRLGQKKGFGVSKMSTKDIESKLGETLDNEVIEPILRVNRAYKFGNGRRECAKYVICRINMEEEASKSGLKPGITKLASLGASWFLSGNLSMQFWDFYSAAMEERSCSKFDNKCSDFDSEDLKATTEYFHSEL